MRFHIHKFKNLASWSKPLPQGTIYSIQFVIEQCVRCPVIKLIEEFSQLHDDFGLHNYKSSKKLEILSIEGEGYCRKHGDDIVLKNKDGTCRRCLEAKSHDFYAW